MRTRSVARNRDSTERPAGRTWPRGVPQRIVIRTYAVPAGRPRARDTALPHRGSVLFPHVVQGPVRHAALAHPRLHFPADELSVVHRGATVVRWAVDVVAHRGTRRCTHDRHLAGGWAAKEVVSPPA